MIFEVDMWCLKAKQTKSAKKTDGQKLKRNFNWFFLSVFSRSFYHFEKTLKTFARFNMFPLRWKTEKKCCSSEIFLYCQENPILTDNGVQTPYSRVD